jgi:Domain of Unknown Function (DUF748)
MKLLRRILVILTITIVSAIVLLSVFLSPITKWAIEKYSVEYTGRQVKMDKLFINLFTGSVSSHGFKIYEANSDKLFFQADELYAHIILHKVLSSEYELTDIKFTKPQVVFIQKGKRFNFSDLVDRFATPDVGTVPANNKPFKWKVDNFDIDSATITYTNTAPYNIIQIQHCSISIPDMAWDNPAYSINGDFDLASGGSFKARSSFNKSTLIYTLQLNINQFNINPWYVYLKDYMKVNALDGLISTNINITGNMHNTSAIAASGNITVDKFSIIDNVNDKLTSVDKMDIEIDSINTEKNIYHFATITLDKPYFKFEMYKDGYNIDRLLTSPAATTDTSSATYSNIFLMMADYIQNITQDYVASNYNADKFMVQDGQLVFYDYTLHEKFRYSLDSLDLLSDKISSNSTKICLDASAWLNHSGSFKGKMDINPKDFKDFDIDCAVKDVNVADFNPYTKYYVATPFLSGIGDYANKTTVVNRQLKSDNILVVNKVLAGKKDKTYKPVYNMPVRLAVAILRDVHGDIKLDIPVAGSLDDPKFKFGKIVWQILGNMMVKAATAPFHMLAGAFGGKDDDYKEIDFDYLQTTVTAVQQKQLDQLAKMVKNKPELKIELIQVVNKEDEAEDLAVCFAKGRYLGLTVDSLTNDELHEISSVETDDSSFIDYIDSVQKTTTYLSTQEKCVLWIGKDNLDKSIDSIMQKRNEAVAQYLSQQHVPAANVFIHNTDKPNDPNLGNFPKLIINVASDEDDKKAN